MCHDPTRFDDPTSLIVHRMLPHLILLTAGLGVQDPLRDRLRRVFLHTRTRRQDVTGFLEIDRRLALLHNRGELQKPVKKPCGRGALSVFGIRCSGLRQGAT